MQLDAADRAALARLGVYASLLLLALLALLLVALVAGLAVRIFLGVA